MTPRSKLRALSVLATLFFCFLAAGSMDDPSNNTSTNTSTSTPAPADNTPAIQVSAPTLYRAYHRNEVAADAAYKGRILDVRGIVSSIDKDFMDQVVIRLATDNEFESVDANLQKSEASQASQLEKGQMVRVSCTGGGMVIGSPVLNDCTFSPNR